MSGFFGPSNDDLISLKDDLVSRIDQLQALVNSRAVDSDTVAREAAERAVSSANEIRSITEEISSIFSHLKDSRDDFMSQISEFQESISQAETLKRSLDSRISSIESEQEKIAEIRGNVASLSNEIQDKNSEIDGYLEESKSFPDAVVQTKSVFEEINGLHEKIKNLLNHSIKKKSEIDDLHKEIYGEDISAEGENDQVEHVDGLRDELNSSYDEIERKVGELRTTLSKQISEIESEHAQRMTHKEGEFDALIESSKNSVREVDEELRNLLPGAMAAGLSAAYEKKKEDELLVLNGANTRFGFAILWMVLVSIIPFAVDVYLIGVQGKELVDVLKETPSLVISILPLYFPILWMAYSANKKSNLSKRLIEEYTHKSVLGKTFSGLSHHIESLPHQSDVKEDLRIRLLYNVLQVSAENPGKLISNYEKSDHPLMDALENSAKLSSSVDSLARIPGFAALARKLSSKGDQILAVQNSKVIDGLAAQDRLNTEVAEVVGTSDSKTATA